MINWIQYRLTYRPRPLCVKTTKLKGVEGKRTMGTLSDVADPDTANDFDRLLFSILKWTTYCQPCCQLKITSYLDRVPPICLAVFSVRTDGAF